MRSTCVSMNCPFIKHCNDYSLTAERNGKCKTKDWFIKAAKRSMASEDPEYCLQTNCLGCALNTGDYKDCIYFERKRTMRKERKL